MNNRKETKSKPTRPSAVSGKLFLEMLKEKQETKAQEEMNKNKRKEERERKERKKKII